VKLLVTDQHLLKVGIIRSVLALILNDFGSATVAAFHPNRKEGLAVMFRTVE
jgi:hypothetical protein